MALMISQVQCPGVRVTVIDDVEGRDMPLLRAEVGSLDMTHESGPGMARYDIAHGTAVLDSFRVAYPPR